jgi:FKBP-type peptidyl-prolyl cis-trans isomerase FklB
MKKLFLSSALIGALLPSAQATDSSSTNSAFPTEISRVSYALGVMYGDGWRSQGVDIDPDLFAKAAKTIQSGGTPLLTKEEAKQTLQAFGKEMQAKQQAKMAEQQAKMAEQGAKNKADGEAFLAKNKTQAGVITLPDGLQYSVITNGTGPLPSATDTVTVNYRGTLIDGTEFDSSYKRGQPASFPVGGVIHGWTEALQKMPVGSKWKLFIPSELAYGEPGRPGIPPSSTLIFEVELLSIQPPQPAPAAAAPLTSDIIKVPSAEEMKKGAKIEVIKPEDAAKAAKQ